MTFDHDNILWFGKHRNKKLSEIPAAWFFWYRDNARDPDTRILDYIEKNIVDLTKRELSERKNPSDRAK